MTLNPHFSHTVQVIIQFEFSYVQVRLLATKTHNPGVFQGSHPGGVKRGQFQEKILSESVRAADRPGPADPTDPTFGTQMSQRDPFVCRFIIVQFMSRRKPSIFSRRCKLSQ
jgi:hypothetical protein